MNTKLITFLIMLCPLIGITQEDTNTTGGYGGPLIYASQINGDWGVMVGGKGGGIFNNKFGFGGIGMAFVSQNEFTRDDLNGNSNALLNLNYGVGGVFFEYIIKSDGPLHVSVPVNILGGGVAVNENSSDIEVESSGVFIIEPGVSLGIMVSEFFAPTIDIFYRRALASSLENLSNSDISDLSIGLTLKFGGS